MEASARPFRTFRAHNSTSVQCSLAIGAWKSHTRAYRVTMQDAEDADRDEAVQAPPFTKQAINMLTHQAPGIAC